MVLGLSLSCAALSALLTSTGSRPVGRLAQQQPIPRSGDPQLQELLHLAAALEAKGDTAEVVRLWQQILAFRLADQPFAEANAGGRHGRCAQRRGV